MALDRRKADTRAKINLGGLVVKAGLAEHDPAVLLGLLVTAADRLNDPAEVRRLRDIGYAMMLNKGTPDADPDPLPSPR